MLNINDILDRIIDVKRSVIDIEKSEPKRGRYTFKKLVYYETKGKRLQDCPWKFAFLHQDKEGTSLNHKMIQEEWDFVREGDDFIPNGVPVNSEGHYQVGDLVLCKKPLAEWLKARLERFKADRDAPDNLKKKFRAEAHEDGVSVNEEQLAKMLGLT